MSYQLASSSWDQSELQAMQKIIDSGNFSMGKTVLEFEKQFAAYVNSKYCVMVNSGSSANLLMMASLRYKKDSPLQPGDEVIVPAVSWSTTYAPLYQYGYHLKFVDVDINTLNYDLEQLEHAITDKTRCIVAVNILGNPNNFSKINVLIAEKEIVLIEDNCESLGATFDGRQAGTFGLMGSFSTFFSHHISTMEGGMVVTDDEELYQIMLSVRAHGWTRNLPKDNLICEQSKDASPFYDSFRFILPGYNLRPGELNAAIGIVQLEKLDNIVNARRNNATIFKEMINQYPLLTQQENGESSWFGFTMILNNDSGCSRDIILKEFAKTNIEVRPIVSGNFTKNEVIKYFDYSIHGTLSNADSVHTQGFFVGNHHYSLANEIELLEKTLKMVMG